ncbi:DUF1549 and DUF1553 domain-containing protein [Anatilimnocola floriformis]|uniref:DUF1549 and DUF1553 domain-containing protein n=1 Tax=Anatilimnocola floriformis TaxID=2948575 RepID=UPI0020C3A091|nr:DUF1549 and DUF1553 domain-containing protein [Anatilimnocola floriformis]
MDALFASLLRARSCLLVALLCTLTWSSGQADESVPSFRRDVMAVLSRAGCNLGACHGNLNGKGGLKLSLRGEDPAADYQTLVRQLEQRRVNLQDPAASLILQKPVGQLAHQGGVRFHRDSNEYRVLHDWIAAGAPAPIRKEPKLVRLEVTPSETVVVAPADSQALEVHAVFADGSRRDVRQLAVFELTDNLAKVDPLGVVKKLALGETTILVRYLQQQVPVRIAFLPSSPAITWQATPAANRLDELIYQRLQTLQLTPSEPCDDATYLRRAHLDLLGVLPTPDEAQTFFSDAAPDKREQLIDRLLTRPEFAEQWALKWSDLLRNEEKVLDTRGVDVFYAWLKKNFSRNTPLSQVVRELVTATGGTYENPPANYYRAMRDPFTRGETTARLFLGVRLQCARCHNHPFDAWTQDDYYNWSGVFARIDYEVQDNKRKDKFDKNEFVGQQIVKLKDDGEVKNARTGKDAQPKLLGAKQPLNSEDERLAALGDWLTSADNKRFAENQANLIWYHLLGRGLVEPIDDFRSTNPAVHPQLLAQLTDDLIASEFDLRALIREIITSQVYQFSSSPNLSNGQDARNFSRTLPQRLSAEKLLDAQCQVLGVAADFNGYPLGTRAGQLRGVERERARDKKPSTADRFLKTFGKPDRLLACECERSGETTLKQAFVLLGDQGLEERLADQNNRLAKLANSEKSTDEIVAELYFVALLRQPTSAELAAAKTLLAQRENRFAGLQDLAWALLNSKEFIFRH